MLGEGRTRIGLALVLVALVAAGVAYAAAGLTGQSDRGGESGPDVAFREVGSELGFEYETTRDESEPLIANHGVYVTDYDENGYPDLLVTGAEPTLFANDEGTFRRTNAVPSVDGYVKGAHVVDYDVDGDDDVLLFRRDDAPIFLENRGGSYVTRDVGFDSLSLDVPMGAASADYTGNGCPDLFIYQNGDWRGGFPGTSVDKQRTISGEGRPRIDDGGRNLLFAGDCTSFENVTAEANITGRQWTLSASFVDFTGDGWPDIHVANDFGNDVLYVNRQNGTFEYVDLGPATDRNAMSSEVADLDSDGRLDVFVTNIYMTENMTLVGFEGTDFSIGDVSWNPDGNNLLRNLGDGQFEDVAPEYGVVRGGWGWAAVADDLDNDGYLDLLHATSSNIPMAEYPDLGFTSPQLWEGTSDGLRRANATAEGFLETNGRGVVTLDADRDGDLDVAIADAPAQDLAPGMSGTGETDEGTPFKLYENVGAGSNSLVVHVDGDDGRTSLGTRVTVNTTESTMLRVKNSKGDFASQDTRSLHFGLGEQRVEQIRVEWPDGTEQTFTDVPDSTHVRLTPDGISSDSVGDPS